MNRCIVLAIGLLLVGGSAVGQKAKRGGSADAAVIETILEDQDQLSRLTAAHSRQIKELEERIANLEKRLELLQADAEQAKKVRQELEATRATLQELRAQEAGIFVGSTKEPGRVNVWLRPRFELRIRPEYEKSRRDFVSGTKDTYYAQRLRFGAEIKAGSKVRAVAIMQDSRLWGEEADTISNERNLDLYEGYLEARDFIVDGLGIQAGRMEMKYGAERQIGSANWSNVGRAFDGAKIFYERPKLLKIHAFATVIRDRVDEDQDFFGLYVSSDYFSFLDLDFYTFFLYNDMPLATEKIGVIGARAVIRPVEGLLLEGEAAVQYGRSRSQYQTRPGTNKHLATAYFAQVLYEMAVYGRPTFGLFLYSASGDADPTDNRNVAYRVLFPSVHGMLGFMDLFEWTGNWDIGPTLRFHPVEGLSLRLDYHFFFLSSDGGVLEKALGGTAILPAGQGHFLGHEMDIVAAWQVTSYLSLETGYSFFKPGKVLSSGWVMRDGEQIALGDNLAHWFYIQGTLKF